MTFCKQNAGRAQSTAEYELFNSGDESWTFEHVTVQQMQNVRTLTSRVEGSSTDAQHRDTVTLPDAIPPEDRVGIVFTVRVRTPSAPARLRGIRVQYSVDDGLFAGQHDDVTPRTSDITPQPCG